MSKLTSQSAAIQAALDELVESLIDDAGEARRIRAIAGFLRAFADHVGSFDVLKFQRPFVLLEATFQALQQAQGAAIEPLQTPTIMNQLGAMLAETRSIMAETADLVEALAAA